MPICKVCGAPHRACGPSTSGTVVPIDTRLRTKENTVGELKPYDVVVPGRHEHKTTLMLSDEDARAQGLLEEKAAPKPQNKARTPRNKSKA